MEDRAQCRCTDQSPVQRLRAGGDDDGRDRGEQERREPVIGEHEGEAPARDGLRGEVPHRVGDRGDEDEPEYREGHRRTGLVRVLTA